MITLCRSIIISYYHLEIKGAYLPLFKVAGKPLQYQSDNIPHDCVMFFKIFIRSMFVFSIVIPTARYNQLKSSAIAKANNCLFE